LIFFDCLSLFGGLINQDRAGRFGRIGSDITVGVLNIIRLSSSFNFRLLINIGLCLDGRGSLGSRCLCKSLQFALS
jgi:hypothetical protein